MKSIRFPICASSLCALFFASCGNYVTDSSPDGFAAVAIHASIARPAGAFARRAGAAATEWSECIISIAAPDMDTAVHVYDVSPDERSIRIEIDHVPAGDRRSISAVTVDQVGDTIHRAAEIVRNLRAAETIDVNLHLEPLCGSIYVELAEFPDNVTTVGVAFVTAENTWERHSASTSSKRYLTLDKIPFGTSGELRVSGISATGDTITSWSMAEYVFENLDTTLEASFVTIATVSLSLSIDSPPATVVRGFMDTTRSIPDESGDLILTEIMYAANDSEYIELFNAGQAAYDDTLIVQIDQGAMRYFDIHLGVGEYITLGRRNLAWTDTAHEVASALDLSSASGNWLIVRAADSTVMDVVAFQTGSNDMSWPKISGKASIALTAAPSGPEDNNCGTAWDAAVSSIDVSVTEQLGTPGAGGL
jgi:hypothetical protein